MAELRAGRIPMNDQERAAVNQLLADHGRSDRLATVQRSEPNESGPLLVSIGRRQWFVTEAGRTREAN